jgi:hypothetical protein
MASDSRGWIYSAGSSGSMSVTGGSCSCTQSGSFYVNQATAYVDSGQADHEVDFTFNSTRTAIVMAARSTNQDCAYLRQSAADTLELTFINYTGNEIDDTFVANIAGWSDGNKGTLRVSAGAVRIYRQGALVSGPHALLGGLTGTTAGWRCHEPGHLRSTMLRLARFRPSQAAAQRERCSSDELPRGRSAKDIEQSNSNGDETVHDEVLADQLCCTAAIRSSRQSRLRIGFPVSPVETPTRRDAGPMLLDALKDRSRNCTECPRTWGALGSCSVPITRPLAKEEASWPPVFAISTSGTQRGICRQAADRGVNAAT